MELEITVFVIAICAHATLFRNYSLLTWMAAKRQPQRIAGKGKAPGRLAGAPEQAKQRASATPPASVDLLALKTAVQASDLSSALRHFGRLCALSGPSTTASDAPQGLALQLVRLAMQQGRFLTLLSDVECVPAVARAEVLNACVAECAVRSELKMCEQAEAAAKLQGVTFTEATHCALVRGA